MVQLFTEQLAHGTQIDKVRALGIAIEAAGGVPNDDLDRLCQLGKLGPHRKALDNFVHFGLSAGSVARHHVLALCVCCHTPLALLCTLPMSS
jgi:hypothetical protein